MQSTTLFAEEVRSIVRTIKAGETMSYATVAAAVGRPRAHRAVATVMANNYDLTVPCHRVIKSDGTLGDYNRGGIERKRELLIAEGALRAQ